MSVSVAVSNRRRRKIARVGVFALAFSLLSQQVAFQDLGALLAHQPGVRQRAHQFVIDSPFGTIHAATFSMPRPIGTAIPHPPVYALANFDPLDVAKPIGAQWLGDPSGPLQFPKVNRGDKRDSYLSRRRKPLPPLPPLLAIEPLPQAAIDAMLKQDEADGRFDPYAQYAFAAPLEPPSESATFARLSKKFVTEDRSATPPARKSLARIYFGAAPFSAANDELKPYAPGKAPVVKMMNVSGDPDIKLAALVPGDKADSGEGGESIADKGEVTGVDQRPQSPAARLSLHGKAREKAEKCLANAVYFEARSEPVKGQIAVAQVVMNRVFSPFYPDTVCGVVYQNANRHLSCQFTFACDGIPEVVTEPDAWARAKRIARDMLDGKLWMPEVAKSTHYHAYWVHPDWVREMRKIYRLGVHTFYRPRAWGDGAEEPSWSDPKTTAQDTKQIKKM